MFITAGNKLKNIAGYLQYAMRLTACNPVRKVHAGNTLNVQKFIQHITLINNVK